MGFYPFFFFNKRYIRPRQVKCRYLKLCWSFWSVDLKRLLPSKRPNLFPINLKFSFINTNKITHHEPVHST